MRPRQRHTAVRRGAVGGFYWSLAFPDPTASKQHRTLHFIPHAHFTVHFVFPRMGLDARNPSPMTVGGTELGFPSRSVLSARRCLVLVIPPLHAFGTKEEGLAAGLLGFPGEWKERRHCEIHIEHTQSRTSASLFNFFFFSLFLISIHTRPSASYLERASCQEKKTDTNMRGKISTWTGDTEADRVYILLGNMRQADFASLETIAGGGGGSHPVPDLHGQIPRHTRPQQSPSRKIKDMSGCADMLQSERELRCCGKCVARRCRSLVLGPQVPLCVPACPSVTPVCIRQTHPLALRGSLLSHALKPRRPTNPPGCLPKGRLWRQTRYHLHSDQERSSR